MTLFQTWKNLHTFQNKYRAIATLIWLFSILLSCFLYFLAGWNWSTLWMPAFANIAIAYLLLATLSRYEKTLNHRADAGDNAPIWRVSVNSVIVGTIPDSHYAAIQHSIWLDIRTYLAQLTNLGQVLYRITNTLFVAIPLGVFWCGLLCFFFAPNTFVSILAELQQATPAQIVAGTHTLMGLLVISSIMLIAVAVATGLSFGFTNCFDLAVNKAVRAAVDCAADGETSLLTSGMATTPTETDSNHPQTAN